jgi:hypothetical protein
MRTGARLGLGGAVSAAVLALGAAGCGTRTTLSDVWTAHDVPPVAMRSVLVIGARMDNTSRRSLEDGMAASLALHGVRATPSYALFPNGFPSADQARQAVEQVGFQGLLVSTSKGTTERTTIVPGAYDFWTGYYYGPGWGGWYPGYVYTDQFVKFETSLWDERAGGKLVWSAITQTENPSSGRDFVHSLRRTVVPALARAGLIPVAGAPERLSLSHGAARAPL